MSDAKYRLVTRSDFDGLVCAALLKEIDMIDRIKFVHPKDMQDGKIQITGEDITTNLPYVPTAHLAFDHHASEVARVGEGDRKNYIIDPKAPSAARVVYDYFGANDRFPRISDEMMVAVDKADSGMFTEKDVMDPDGWELLNFIMDPRTGLGRFREFRISNYQLMMDLIDHCRTKSIEEIMQLPDVKERAELYRDQQDKFKEQLMRCSKVEDSAVVIDYRNEDPIYAGNRFYVYGAFPTCDVSVHIMWGLGKENTVIAIGRSILNRTSGVDIGELCLKYGGGGHEAAGTCQVANDQAESTLEEILTVLNTR